MALAPQAMPYWTCLRLTPPPSIPVGTMMLIASGNRLVSVMVSVTFAAAALDAEAGEHIETR